MFRADVVFTHDARLLLRSAHTSTSNCGMSTVQAPRIERRASTSRAKMPRRFTSSKDAADWGMSRLGALEHEELWLLALDARGRLRTARRIAKGGLCGIGLRAKDPLVHALRAGALGFVLLHNHPSGDPTPSAEDLAFTKAVALSAEVVGLPLLASGDESDMSREVRRFAKALGDLGGLPVHLVDEGLSSWEAEEALRARRVPLQQARRDGLVDREAAVLLLRAFLADRPGAGGPPEP